MIALADFPSGGDDQLELIEGQTYFRLVEDYGNGWSYGVSMDGTVAGVYPMTFVQVVEQ